MRFLASVLTVSVVFSLSVVRGQTLLYPPSDPAKDIAAALTAAAAEHKRVLIDFGADWCPDCRVLGALFEDPQVAPFLAQNFRVVHVDVGRRDKHADIVAKYGATSGDWIPAVVVLDADGSVAGATDDTLRLTRRDTPATLLAVLQRWAPKQLLAAPAEFSQNGVRVTVGLEVDARGGTWLVSRFEPIRPDVHLYAADWPDDGVAGLGRPTKAEIVDGGAVTPIGRAAANRGVHDDRIDVLHQTLRVYPNGPVTLVQPVRVSRARDTRTVSVHVTYMGCGESGCLPPVVARPVELRLRAFETGLR